MKSKSLLSCLIVILFVGVDRQSIYADEEKRYVTALTQGITYNYLQTSFNRQILDSTFSYISLDSIEDNLSTDWVWDSDTFIINHVGHPIQGGIYFTAARSNHLDFYESFVSTTIGSLTWEYFLENETQSINDIIVTTTGGAVIGEIFYRLSDSIWYANDTVMNKFVASIFSPMSTLNRVVFNEESRSVIKQDIHGSFKTNYNFLYAYAESGSEKVLLDEYDLGFDEFNTSLNLLTDIEYGNNFVTNNKPFDYFKINMGIGIINDGLTLNMFSEGLLKGLVLDSSLDTKKMIGLYLSLDYLYGNDTINLGSNSLGLGFSYNKQINEGLEFDLDLFGNFIFLGSSDYAELKYLDTLGSTDEERRNYNIEIGENFKLYGQLDKKNFGSISLKALIYNMHIISDSVEDEGSNGNDLISLFELSFEKDITYEWSVGTSLKSYHKYGFYVNSDDIVQILSGISFYFMWSY